MVGDLKFKSLDIFITKNLLSNYELGLKRYATLVKAFRKSVNNNKRVGKVYGNIGTYELNNILADVHISIANKPTKVAPIGLNFSSLVAVPNVIRLPEVLKIRSGAKFGGGKVEFLGSKNNEVRDFEVEVASVLKPTRALGVDFNRLSYI